MGDDPLEEVPRVRVAIVEDHELLAQSLGAALKDEGLDVHLAMGPAADDIVAATDQHKPDLVLLDLHLGEDIGMSIPLIRPITQRGGRVVMLTGSTDTVELASCVEQGAVGVLNKSMSFDALLAAVRETLSGGTLLTAHQREELLSVLRRSRRDSEQRQAPFNSLTPREQEVLASLMDGAAAETIAKTSFVSVATVRSQIRSILSKLGVNSQLAAVALARKAGWPQPPSR